MMRNTEWGDPIRFYTNELRYTQSSARIYTDLGMEEAAQRKASATLRSNIIKKQSRYFTYSLSGLSNLLASVRDPRSSAFTKLLTDATQGQTITKGDIMHALRHQP